MAGFNDTITGPTTNLSCSICSDEYSLSHLDRNIAVGFENFEQSAIKSINFGYNNNLDGYSFKENETSLAKIYELLKRWGIK